MLSVAECAKVNRNVHVFDEQAVLPIATVFRQRDDDAASSAGVCW